MSTAKVEDAQPEPVPSTTQESTKTEEDTPATKTDDKDVKTEFKDTKKNGTEKKDKNGLRTYEDGVLKTSAQEDPSDRRNNSKYDPSVLPETNDPQLIRNQVEFYFSDSNLPGDKYLWNATDGTNNLPVKIEKICTFGRMKRFRPISAVVAALRDSKFLEVTGPEGLEEVKRRVAYDPTIPRSKSESRSIYAKGFGDEEPSSQFDIEAFFAPYGPTNSVRLRRTEEKLFKGSVFVEFQDDATCEAFLALDPKPLWKGKHTLIFKPKKQYQDEKEQEIKDGKIQPGPSYGRGRGRGRGGRGGNRGRNDRDRNGRDRGGRDRGDRDPDDWKRRREDDRANGFRDDRNRQDNKGGRGRGRREDRGPRNTDRNSEREEREEKNGEDSEKKVDSKSEPVAEAPKVENNKKRAREDDGEEGAPAKKVDSKSEAATES